MLRRFNAALVSALTLLFIFISIVGLLIAGTLPNGMAFAGLIEGEWRIYTAHDGEINGIDGIEHPRTFSYHAVSGLIAYIGADSHLSVYSVIGENDVPELKMNLESRYTQPSFSSDGQWLLAVELPEGKSRRTIIVGFNMESGRRFGFVKKRTAQFEPTMVSERYLHYSTATCVDDCGGMIWELWRRDMQTAKQVQLTLLNAVSNQPHVHDGQIYFSSDADGGRFHIWSMDDEVGAKPVQLTTGNVRDSDPTTDRNGTLYFLRKEVGMTSIMKLEGEKVVALSLSERFDDIRNLEISR